MKRIDFLELQQTQYNVLHHFTQKLYEAATRIGIPSRYIPSNEGKIRLDSRDLPTFTFCFNGIPQDDNENLLCDLIGVPHITALVDSPLGFSHLIKSPLMIIGCDDKSGCRILHEMKFDQTFFFPHAVESSLNYDSKAERPYDVAFFASCIDYESLREDWINIYPEEVSKAMDATIEIVFSSSPQSFVEALHQMMQEYVPDSRQHNLCLNTHFQNLCVLIEAYIKGKERVEMVRSIHDVDVHLFGNSSSKKGWKDYLKGQPNIILHDAIDYEKSLEITKQTKILLNSSIKNKEGAHERIFSGLACGALVATFINPYLEKECPHGLLHTDQLNNRILEYLQNEKKRASEAAAGRQVVMEKHTWDQRANVLKSILVSLPTLD